MIEPKFTDFFEAWWYLQEHPRFIDPSTEFNEFSNLLTIDVVKVNPLMEEISDEIELNVATRVWLECCYKEWDPDVELYVSIHDYELDCGGPTFEEAIIKLANKHYNKYDNK